MSQADKIRIFGILLCLFILTKKTLQNLSSYLMLQCTAVFRQKKLYFTLFFQFTSWVDAVIFVFSLENETSFNAIYNYYAKMSQYRNMHEIPLILVGTQGMYTYLGLKPKKIRKKCPFNIKEKKKSRKAVIFRHFDLHSDLFWSKKELTEMIFLHTYFI